MSKKIFLNLTNGIEAVEKYGLDPGDVSFIRLQSCHCERHKFDEIIKELDHNFLMCLALGMDCVVYDFGANSALSKAVYLGLEWVRYVLERRWFGRASDPVVKGKRVAAHFEKYYSELQPKTKKKVDYYKKYLATSIIHLEGISSETANDNKPGYFRGVLEQYFYNDERG